MSFYYQISTSDSTAGPCLYVETGDSSKVTYPTAIIPTGPLVAAQNKIDQLTVELQRVEQERKRLVQIIVQLRGTIEELRGQVHRLQPIFPRKIKG